MTVSSTTSDVSRGRVDAGSSHAARPAEPPRACTLPDGRVVAVTHREVFVTPVGRLCYHTTHDGLATVGQRPPRDGSRFNSLVDCGAAQSGEMTGDAYVLDRGADGRALSATGSSRARRRRRAARRQPRPPRRRRGPPHMLGLAPLAAQAHAAHGRAETNAGRPAQRLACSAASATAVMVNGGCPFVSTTTLPRLEAPSLLCFVQCHCTRLRMRACETKVIATGLAQAVTPRVPCHLQPPRPTRPAGLGRAAESRDSHAPSLLGRPPSGCGTASVLQTAR